MPLFSPWQKNLWRFIWFSQNLVSKEKLKAFFSQTTITLLFAIQSDSDIPPSGWKNNNRHPHSTGDHVLNKRHKWFIKCEFYLSSGILKSRCRSCMIKILNTFDWKTLHSESRKTLHTKDIKMNLNCERRYFCKFFRK